MRAKDTQLLEQLGYHKQRAEYREAFSSGPELPMSTVLEALIRILELLLEREESEHAWKNA